VQGNCASRLSKDAENEGGEREVHPRIRVSSREFRTKEGAVGRRHFAAGGRVLQCLGGIAKDRPGLKKEDSVTQKNRNKQRRGAKFWIWKRNEDTTRKRGGPHGDGHTVETVRREHQKNLRGAPRKGKNCWTRRCGGTKGIQTPKGQPLWGLGEVAGKKKKGQGTRRASLQSFKTLHLLGGPSVGRKKGRNKNLGAAGPPGSRSLPAE